MFISAGAHASRKLGIEGEDRQGVEYGVEFLRNAGSAAGSLRGKENVVVIGGGNVAIDVARTALRLGAKNVSLVSLEQYDEMPAYEEEMEATRGGRYHHAQRVGSPAHRRRCVQPAASS